MRRMIKKKHSYFITGIISLIPIVLTLYIIKKIFEIFIGLVKAFIPLNIIISKFKMVFHIPEKFVIDTMVNATAYIITILLTYILILICGISVRHFINIEMAKQMENVFLKIPFIKPIYGTIKQIIDMVMNSSGEAYKGVVMIEYPKAGVYSVGFLINTKLGKIQEKFEEKEMVSIFIPTAPNPTTGFYIIVERKNITELDIKVDEALKMIVSAGAITPQNEQNDKKYEL